MDTTIGYVVCTLILMVGSGIGGWYMCRIIYKKKLIELQLEIKQIQANYQLWLLAESDEPQYTPEVIGEHITEPTDLDIERTAAYLINKDQQWRDRQSKECSKDIDRRTPGYGC